MEELFMSSVHGKKGPCQLWMLNLWMPYYVSFYCNPYSILLVVAKVWQILVSYSFVIHHPNYLLLLLLHKSLCIHQTFPLLQLTSDACMHAQDTSSPVNVSKKSRAGYICYRVEECDHSMVAIVQK